VAAKHVDLRPHGWGQARDIFVADWIALVPIFVASRNWMTPFYGRTKSR